jgi:hypothetical protein
MIEQTLAASENQLRAIGCLQVPQAFNLGWLVSHIYRFPTISDDKKVADTNRDELPRALGGMEDLLAWNRVELLTKQFAAGASLFWPKAKVTELTHTLSVADLFTKEKPVEELRRRTWQQHVVLLADLYTKDARLGRSYELGLALSETALEWPGDAEDSVRRRFASQRIALLSGWLIDLKTCFPKHTAEAVRVTLAFWAWCLETSRAKLDAPSMQSALRRQGELWRSLLAGEKDPRDLLEVSHYVAAARTVVKAVAALGTDFILSRGGAVIAAMGLIAVALLTLVIMLNGSILEFAGALVGLFTSVGLTAGGAWASVRRVLTSAEAPLWEAGLAPIIAAAAFIGPDGNQKLDSSKLHSAELGRSAIGVGTAKDAVPETV